MIKSLRILVIGFFYLFSPFLSAGNILEEINGRPFSFSQLEGKWVFINYWATWCQFCLDEIPEFNRFYDRYKNQDIQVFAVNFDGLPIVKQKKLIKQLDIHYPSLKYDPSNILHLGDIQGLPITFVFDPQGHLNTKLYGGQTYDRLNKLLIHLKALKN